jgi:hypothetical protein
MPGLTVRHYFGFGVERAVLGDDLLSAAAWDALRTRTDGVFSLPTTREALIRVARSYSQWVERAALLNAMIGDRTIASYGVGSALIEVLLLDLAPRRRMTLTQYAPATVERLTELLPDQVVVLHDVLNDPPLAADLHLFHRLDVSLSGRQWHQVFRALADQPILFVGEPVSPARAWKEMRLRRQRRANGVMAGWIRTRGAYESLWRATHRHEHRPLNDMDAWFLTPRSSR